MKMLLMVILVISSLGASSDNELYKELENLNNKQKQVLVRTFLQAKVYNYEYTLTAIAWQESHFGKYPINLNDPSFGVFHNNIKSVANRHNVKLHSYKASRLAESLVLDFDFSFAEALSEIKFWENYYRKSPNKWRYTVQSYNAGFNKKYGLNYLKGIQQKIKILHKFFKNKNLNFCK